MEIKKKLYKNGVKLLKIVLGYIKKNRGGGASVPPIYTWGKMDLKGEGGWNDLNAQDKPLPIVDRPD